MENLLVANNVSKTFGTFTALNNVSIEVPKGSIFGLLGPNGAGKTTFIRIINQITMPDTGSVFLDGEALKPHHIQHIGYLCKQSSLSAPIGVVQAECGLIFHGGSKKKDETACSNGLLQ